MKILHLTGDREDAGGILSVLRNLQEASRPWGWQHVAWVHRGFAQKRRPALELRTGNHCCAESAQHWRMVWRALRSWPGLKRLLATEEYDLVHAHTRGTLLLGLGIASRLGRKVIFTNHNYARRKAAYRRLVDKPRFYTVLLTPNMGRYYGIEEAPPKVSVISACCADALFQEPLTTRRPAGARSRPIQLVGLGTIQVYKRWHLAAEALLLLTPEERGQLEISVYGPTLNEPEAQRYDRELRSLLSRHRLESSLRLRGVTADVPGCLRACDWFFLPSTNEPCSVALMEALALGVPVLVSASGGNVDIVDSAQAGLLFEPENPQALAACFRRILRGDVQPAPPAEIRDTVRDRSASTVAARYGELYRHVLALA